jgi:hypothetical protein
VRQHCASRRSAKSLYQPCPAEVFVAQAGAETSRSREALVELVRLLARRAAADSRKGPAKGSS